MKKNIILLLTSALFFASCGGTKSVDIPLFTLGNGPIWGSQVPSDCYAKFGKATVKGAVINYGSYSEESNLMGLPVVMGDKKMVLLSEGSASIFPLASDKEYSLHVMTHKEDKDNPYTAVLKAFSLFSLTGEKAKMVNSDYSDTYYFVNDKELNSAVTYIQNIDKQKNMPSSYHVKDFQKEHKGAKCYNSKVGSAVEYTGMQRLKFTTFVSLYLECGAVVNLYIFNKPASSLVGESIDCVVTKDNTVIEYSFY